MSHVETSRFSCPPGLDMLLWVTSEICALCLLSRCSCTVACCSYCSLVTTAATEVHPHHTSVQVAVNNAALVHTFTSRLPEVSTCSLLLLLIAEILAEAASVHAKQATQHLMQLQERKTANHGTDAHSTPTLVDNAHALHIHPSVIASKLCNFYAWLQQD